MITAIRNIWCGYKREQSGSATVEFVVTLPILLIVIIFVFEFSRLFWGHHIAESNARSAARYISRAPLVEPYLTRAENIAKTGDPLDSTGFYDWMADVEVDIDTSYVAFTSGNFRTNGTTIRVEMEVLFEMATFRLLNVLSGGSVPDTLTMSVTSQARYIGE